ncbi:haloacid dehalogenase [Lophiostoma macrostomum CBS 122681]|uniref:Haloacid dehalogenase n=1 Tax=Lophiostoma macrostomum CBS 122681 TaxID=1314788 RepID=A0A6A6SQM2_9PLEO|nr:haloacid dehalogenase [Lophiostoma macrostomum CBS 122681]
MALSKPPRALLFDVFGTCVDWRTTVTQALYAKAHAALNSAEASLATSVRLRATDMSIIQWGTLAQQWRDSYKHFTKAIAGDSSLPWKSVDEHHHDALQQLLVEWKLKGLWTDEEVRDISLIWHQLDPWSDSSAGIKALNKLCLLNDLKTHGSLGFTHIFSAEQFGTYKPSPKVYLGAAERLGLQPSECAMVAAHLNDLQAAKSHGLQTIYVERSMEEDWSSQEVEKARSEGWVDLWISINEQGFVTVAEKLGIEVDTGVQLQRSLST